RLVRHRGAGRHAQRDHRQGVPGHEEGARYDRDESALLRAGAGAGRQFAGRVRHGDEGRDRALGERGEGAQHPRPVKIDLRQIEDAAKELYIRALKRLPPDVKQGFDALAKSETDAGARRMLGTMIRNIGVAEDTDNLLCQDTGIPIYNVWIGRWRPAARPARRPSSASASAAPLTCACISRRSRPPGRSARTATTPRGPGWRRSSARR